MASFAEQLTAARKAAGMTQEELAEVVHVARNTISNWERGQRQPDLETLRLLEQALHTDFLHAGEPGAAAEEAAEEAAEKEADAVPAPGAAGKKTRRNLLLAVALAAVLLAACFLLLPALRGKPAVSTPDANGRRYAVADYDKTTPNEAGKAYLTIERSLTVRPGDGKDYYAINFSVREDNGIAFTIDRLECVIFFTDHADVRVFSHNELAGFGYEPDMPAYGFLSIDNGFPTDQQGLQGMSLKIMGTDANGAALTFTSYQPIP